jgi:hypothetical protein
VTEGKTVKNRLQPDARPDERCDARLNPGTGVLADQIIDDGPVGCGAAKPYEP